MGRRALVLLGLLVLVVFLIAADWLVLSGRVSASPGLDPTVWVTDFPTRTPYPGEVTPYPTAVATFWCPTVWSPPTPRSGCRVEPSNPRCASVCIGWIPPWLVTPGATLVVTETVTPTPTSVVTETATPTATSVPAPIYQWQGWSGWTWSNLRQRYCGVFSTVSGHYDSDDYYYIRWPDYFGDVDSLIFERDLWHVSQLPMNGWFIANDGPGVARSLYSNDIMPNSETYLDGVQDLFFDSYSSSNPSQYYPFTLELCMPQLYQPTPTPIATIPYYPTPTGTYSPFENVDCQQFVEICNEPDVFGWPGILLGDEECVDFIPEVHVPTHVLNTVLSLFGIEVGDIDIERLTVCFQQADIAPVFIFGVTVQLDIVFYVLVAGWLFRVFRQM